MARRWHVAPSTLHKALWPFDRRDGMRLSLRVGLRPRSTHAVGRLRCSSRPRSGAGNARDRVARDRRQVALRGVERECHHPGVANFVTSGSFRRAPERLRRAMRFQLASKHAESRDRFGLERRLFREHRRECVGRVFALGRFLDPTGATTPANGLSIRKTIAVRIVIAARKPKRVLVRAMMEHSRKVSLLQALTYRHALTQSALEPGRSHSPRQALPVNTMGRAPAEAPRPGNLFASHIMVVVSRATGSSPASFARRCKPGAKVCAQSGGARGRHVRRSDEEKKSRIAKRDLVDLA